MAVIELLPSEGTFYKANLHMHSTLSDGKLTPEELKRAYQGQGYSVLAYTDHRRYVDHRDLSDSGFVALNGFEADVNDCPSESGDYSQIKCYHLNLFDTTPDADSALRANIPQLNCRYNDHAALNAYIEQMSASGFLVCYNHPYWSMQDQTDYLPLRGCFAMEIFNYGCETEGMYGYHPQVYDEMLRNGQRIFCLATDDNHNAYSFGDPNCDSFGGFTMIKATELAYPSIIKALQAGHFYASMGPAIDELCLDGNKLVVRCSPVENINVFTAGRRSLIRRAGAGNTITGAEFNLAGNEGYIRVDCQDGRGLHACSNAYFLDGLLSKQ